MWFLRKPKEQKTHPFPFYIYIFVFYFLFLIEMYCKFIICHSSHYMLWRTRSTTAIVTEGKHRNTHRVHNGRQSVGLIALTNSEWNIALVIFRVSNLFFLNVFFSCVSSNESLGNIFFHLISPFPIGNSMSPLERLSFAQHFLHGSQHITSLFEVFLFLISFHFTNTTCLETLHRPMFFFFFCQNTTFFFNIILNSPHEPATYVHNAFFVLLKSTNAPFDIFFLYYIKAQDRAGDGGRGSHPSVVCDARPVPVTCHLWCICRTFTCCTEHVSS